MLLVLFDMPFIDTPPPIYVVRQLRPVMYANENTPP